MIQLSKRVADRFLLDVDVNSFGVFYRYNNILMQPVEAIHAGGIDRVLVVSGLKHLYIRLDVFNNMTKKQLDAYIINHIYNFSLN